MRVDRSSGRPGIRVSDEEEDEDEDEAMVIESRIENRNRRSRNWGEILGLFCERRGAEWKCG